MLKLYTYFLSSVLFFVFTFSTSFAQLSGIKTIDNTTPTGGNNYQTFTDAITALNGSGVGAGGVTFNVFAGQTFNENPPVLNATGTLADPIVFQKSGVGTNPKIVPSVAGTLTTTSLGANADGIIIINGGDYITFDGIDLDGNAAFVANATEKFEYGYYTKKASATDACKNVIIRNSTVTMYHGVTPFVTIGSGVFISNISGTATVVVTDVGGRSENIKIHNNTLTGCYIGVQLRGYAALTPFDFYDQNIDIGVDGANNINNYGGSSSTAYGIYGIYQNNAEIANNIINTGSSVTTTTLYGMFMSTGTNSNVDIYNNTVTIHGGGTTSTIYAINNGMGSTGTSNTVNIYNNIVENSTYATATSGSMYGIYNSASALNVNMYGNTVRNNNRAGTSGVLYLLYNSSTGVDGFSNIYNNSVYGNSNTAATGDVFCIYSNEVATATKMIYNNSVYNNSGNDDIHGINSTLGLLAHIYRNNIYDITSTTTLTTSPYSSGITVGSGTNVYVYNNYISDLKAPNSAATDAVRGISLTTATTNATRGVYYNTIFLNASAGGANFGSSGIFHIYSATATSSTLDMRNNNVVNSSINNGTGLTVAFRRSAATNLNNYSTTSNNNNFYAGTPGPSNLLFSDGTNAIQTIGDLKLHLDPRESASLTGNPPFVNSTVAPYDLHINVASPTQLESAGTPVDAPLAITADYDNTPRYPNPGYPFNPSYPPTQPDIGADEFGGIPADLTPPTIFYTQLTNTASTGNRTLTAEITDPAGVQVGANGPRLYYKKSTDPSYIFDNNPLIAGDDYTFTLNTAALGGVVTGTIIQYYVAAQDSAGNGGTNPAGGSGINPPGTTPPGSPNSYTVVPQISGTYTVGATGTYPNLTSVATLLNSANSEVTGNVIFELQADYDGTTETVPINMPEFNNGGLFRGGAFTVTIRPASGVTGKVTSGDPGANFAFAVINFEGGDYYILDGRPGGLGTVNEWTIRNSRGSGTIGPVLRCVNGATNNIFQFLNIESKASLTTTGAIFFHTSTASDGNSFNIVRQNNLRGRTDSAGMTISNGILSNGSLAAPNSNNTITSNHIYNFTGSGISLVATNDGNGPNWTITDNNIYNPLGVPSTATVSGISVASEFNTNTIITGNYVGGSDSLAGGAPWVNTGNVLFSGISCAGGTGTITNNVVSNMSGTGTGTSTRIQGISQTSTFGAYVISNNTITNLSTTGAAVGTAFGNHTARGIYIGPSGQFVGSSVIGNTIDNISIENVSALTTTNVAAGMSLYNLQNTVVANNKVSNIKNKSTGTTAGQLPMACGIFTSYFSNGVVVNNFVTIGVGENTNTQFNGIWQLGPGTSNVHLYYYNTIYVGGTAGGDIGSFGFLRGTDTTNTQNQVSTLIDNIIINTRIGGASVNYAIGNKATTPGPGWNSNYNDLYNPIAATIGLWGVLPQTFASWQLVTSGDANSVSTPVFFADTTSGNLHVTGSSNGDLLLTGSPISGITTDIDGDTRNPDQPYMGADEGSIPLPVELASFTASVNRNNVMLNWTTLTEMNNSGFDIERKLIDEQGLNTFTKIGNVQGHGNSNEPQNYSFNDNGLQTGKYAYRLKQTDYNGNFEYFTLSSDIEVGVPKEFSLSQNYPNPFNPVTKINYDIPFDSKVNLKVYDMLGREVASLVHNDLQKAGYYTVQLNGINMASGTYFFRIIAQGGGKDFVMTKKMVLIK
ncbi:MAG TPA: T9SS type A sorting domain-containing protein [Ignavibacteria bacterium]|nr:T9SS type A sorting domain-containing protein [Ignavibacteria bacterium]